MKKLQLLIAVTILFLASSCKKDKAAEATYTCTTCKTTPDALAANDGSSKGIYKGVIIGSSGTITFNIANNGTTITALMVIDGVTVNLTSAVTWVAGQAYVADFTGTLNGSPVTIRFSVGLSGGTPTVTSSTIPGHPNATLVILKETSNNLVEAFEGTYHTTRPEDGTFNIILSRTLAGWSYIARKNGDLTSTTGSGTISGNNLIDPAQPGLVFGTMSGDNLNGSFQDSGSRTVTITGRRTL
ncbi:MAG: hypothetical protein ABIW38_07765 [Ferruginibacter sp.]